MAQTIHAIDIVVSVDDVVVGCAQAVDVTITQAMTEATCAASGGWAESSPGRKSWTASINALLRRFTPAEITSGQVGYDTIFDKLTSAAKVTLEYGTEVTGDRRYSGDAYINNLKWAKPEDGNVTWSADLTGTGPIDFTTNP